MSNHLITEKSPYLLQHSENPIDWYPWCTEAFEKAKTEDKPIFLSIGYSTCHWCHVMAHESFENTETADILNKYFVSIKVDKEERPDIDNVYMAVCQSFTGSGGWPMSIFLTPEQKPFYAGTYFSETNFRNLLLSVHDKWEEEREELIESAEKITELLNEEQQRGTEPDEKLIADALSQYKKTYDRTYGGFGIQPKFPSPHNLIFLMNEYRKNGDKDLLQMTEKTLEKMYRGGMFDHIGYGFCRYSTDRYFLVPHFEKMLYDNAMLIKAYCKAYEITKEDFFKKAAEQAAFYIMTEMTSENGGFFSGEDADSDGVEGKYYVFAPDEIISLLGEDDGKKFNSYYGITEDGNFEGKSIPNLLHVADIDSTYERFLPKIREYRKKRCILHTDDKILTSWNSLMISALCLLYRITENKKYFSAAEKAQKFIENNLCKNNTLYVSFRDGKKGNNGFIDDYAFYADALIEMYEATLEKHYLNRTKEVVEKAVSLFFDDENGGFYLYGEDNENLISRPKECYDGAIPSGNSVMTSVLVKLNMISPDKKTENILIRQIKYMCGESSHYPSGYSEFLTALSDYLNPSKVITAVYSDRKDIVHLPFDVMSSDIVRAFAESESEYEILQNKTTYYVCKNHSCLPPVNTLENTE